MKRSIFAFIAEPAETETAPVGASPFEAFPPELLEPVSGVWLLPRARAVVVIQQEEGIFVYRISADGQFGGDTWHQSFEEAKHDLGVEFGASSIEQWTDVPEGVDDPVAYVTEQVLQSP